MVQISAVWMSESVYAKTRCRALVPTTLPYLPAVCTTHATTTRGADCLVCEGDLTGVLPQRQPAHGGLG
jgi:hypothetical protein